MHRDRADKRASLKNEQKDLAFGTQVFANG